MVMVTTGRNEFSDSAHKTEILDLVSGKSCMDLADFHVTKYGGVGANLNGTPVVCGGYSPYYQTCDKFINSGWQAFATMNEKRYGAAGLIYNNKFHVFGGHNGITQPALQTTELISIDGSVELGTDLPTAVKFHAMTFFNSSVSILSGGWTKVPHAISSPLSWYFNHETQAFSSGPSLLKPRHSHGSATCVDKVTQEKIPIVAGGMYWNDFLKSTEMLINGIWQSGTFQCKKATLY